MAEFAVNLLIDDLVPLLKEEVNLLRGVGGEFESIKRELEFMKPYLKNADERAERGESDDGVKVLVKQIRNVSFRIEDVIDEYILHLLTQRCGFIDGGCFCKVARSIIKCKPRRKIASEIKAIKADISDINNLRNTYSLHVIEEGSSSNRRNELRWHDPRLASLFPEEAEVVGIETPRAQLNSWMAKEASSKRTVVTVVGEGGLGKTTLVKKVFDDQIASTNFVRHAWITVSHSPPNEKELLRTLMKKLCETALNAIETMDEESLIGKLREYLHQKRKSSNHHYKNQWCGAYFLQESFKVVAANDNILDLQHISSPPASLRRLGLRGRLEKFPVWICKLQNVVRITFWGSSLKEDPLQFLQKLPNLVHLELIEAYDGEILYFGKGGFQKLKKLNLWLMSNLISVKVEKGALPLFQHVYIGACPRLNKVSDKIDEPIFTAFWDSYLNWS